MRRLFVALVASLALSLAAVPASAQGKGSAHAANKHKQTKDAAKYAAEVMILHATNSKRGIDKRIGDMPELKKPPFSSYNSYQLLRRVRLPLDKGQSRTIKLPNGRVLRTQLLDILPRNYLRISASINQPKGKTFLPLLKVKAKVGQAFIVAGQSYKGGILVLVIRVVAR